MFMALSDHEIMITSSHHASSIMTVVKAGVISTNDIINDIDNDTNILLVVTVVTVSSVKSNTSSHLELDVIFLDSMHLTIMMRLIHRPKMIDIKVTLLR